MKRKRQRNQQVAPPFCYSACSCSRLRVGFNIDLHFCFAIWRAVYSSAESLVRRACACLASIHRSGEYLFPYACANFSLAAASCPGRMACRASYSSTGSRLAACDFTSVYSYSAVSSSNVGVGIVAVSVVDRNVGAHPFIHELLPDKILQKLNLLLA